MKTIENHSGLSEKRDRSCDSVSNSESQQVLEAMNAKKVFWLAKARASPGQPRRPWTRTRARRTCRLSPPGAAGSPLTPTRPPTFGRSVLGWTGAQIIIRKLMDTRFRYIILVLFIAFTSTAFRPHSATAGFLATRSRLQASMKAPRALILHCQN